MFWSAAAATEAPARAKATLVRCIVVTEEKARFVKKREGRRKSPVYIVFSRARRRSQLRGRWLQATIFFFFFFFAAKWCGLMVILHKGYTYRNRHSSHYSEHLICQRDLSCARNSVVVPTSGSLLALAIRLQRETKKTKRRLRTERSVQPPFLRVSLDLAVRHPSPQIFHKSGAKLFPRVSAASEYNGPFSDRTARDPGLRTRLPNLGSIEHHYPSPLSRGY